MPYFTDEETICDCFNKAYLNLQIVFVLRQNGCYVKRKAEKDFTVEG